MEILSRITAQIAAVRLPLYAVTVSAVPRPDTPVLLMLHWHGFRRDERDPASPAPAPRPVPGSALQLNLPWHRLEEIDRALLDAAWQLGAWDVERRAARACSHVGASAREALECRQAFGDNPFAPGDEAHLLAEAPDRADLMQLAALKGYVRWLFRPVRGGLWQEAAEDDTLAADGGRAPPCPVAPQAATGGRNARTVYRLGRTSRILVR
ncbi:MAG: diguanylate cyclase [Thiobacillus sp.]